jgi:secreted protein with Ig-like and vWFA domain
MNGYISRGSDVTGLTTVVGWGSDVMGVTTVVGHGSDVRNSPSYVTLNKFTPAKEHFHIKKYDDTGLDKGPQHTKQILAELIEPGGKTIHYEIPELINSIRTRGTSLKSRKTLSASLSYKKGDGQDVVIIKAFTIPTTYKILPNILLSSQVPYADDITAGHLC